MNGDELNNFEKIVTADFHGLSAEERKEVARLACLEILSFIVLTALFAYGAVKVASGSNEPLGALAEYWKTNVIQGAAMFVFGQIVDATTTLVGGATGRTAESHKDLSRNPGCIEMGKFVFENAARSAVPILVYPVLGYTYGVRGVLNGVHNIHEIFRN